MECHQFLIKKRTFLEDMELIKEHNLSSTSIKDYTIYLADSSETTEINTFIRRYEWLGTPSLYTTHRYVARHTKSNVLSAVVTFDMPISFSKLLGNTTKKLERLVSRGASASWTPKNLASFHIMTSIRDMVKNTDYRLFTAYSDPLAGELGTIYQACNFLYLGQNFGSKLLLFDFNNSDRGWFSDRQLRSPSAYRRYAIELGLNWKRGDSISVELRKQFNSLAKEKLNDLVKFYPPMKHKYAYVLGSSKGETKRLLKQFYQYNPKLKNLPYPTERGSW